MKTMHKILLSVLFLGLLVLTACGGSPLPDWAGEETLQKQGEEVIDMMNAQDYEGIAALYNNPEVTADTFAQSGEAVTALGAFTGYGDASYVGGKTDDGQAYGTVIQVANYEGGKLTYTISFFEDGTLAGFFVRA